MIPTDDVFCPTTACDMSLYLVDWIDANCQKNVNDRFQPVSGWSTSENSID